MSDAQVVPDPNHLFTFDRNRFTVRIEQVALIMLPALPM
jgi:hypothetical protein